MLPGGGFGRSSAIAVWVIGTVVRCFAVSKLESNHLFTSLRVRDLMCSNLVSPLLVVRWFTAFFFLCTSHESRHNVTTEGKIELHRIPRSKHHVVVQSCKRDVDVSFFMDIRSTFIIDDRLLNHLCHRVSDCMKTHRLRRLETSLMPHPTHDSPDTVLVTAHKSTRQCHLSSHIGPH